MYFCRLSTHPIGSTHGLIVDTVALGWWQRRVPETAIALVVPDSERLYKCEAGWKKFCSNVVGWLEDGGIVKADRRRETLGRIWGSTAGLGLPFFFYHKLVGAGRRKTVRFKSEMVFENDNTCCWQLHHWDIYMFGQTFLVIFHVIKIKWLSAVLLDGGLSFYHVNSLLSSTGCNFTSIMLHLCLI